MLNRVIEYFKELKKEQERWIEENRIEKEIDNNRIRSITCKHTKQLTIETLMKIKNKDLIIKIANTQTYNIIGSLIDVEMDRYEDIILYPHKEEKITPLTVELLLNILQRSDKEKFIYCFNNPLYFIRERKDYVAFYIYDYMLQKSMDDGGSAAAAGAAMCCF